MNEIILAFAPPEPPAKPPPVTFFFISCAANLRRRPLRRVDRPRRPAQSIQGSGLRLGAIGRRVDTVLGLPLGKGLALEHEFFAKADPHMKAHLFEHDLFGKQGTTFRIML